MNNAFAALQDEIAKTGAWLALTNADRHPAEAERAVDHDGTDPDRYLRIVTWSEDRYTVRGPTGEPVRVKTYRGGSVPSRSTLIEDLAAARYMGLPRHFPGFQLAALPAEQVRA